MSELLRETRSLCPECLAVIEARIVEKKDCVYMEKSCAVHGFFSTLIWENTGENYRRWLEYGGAFDEDMGNCPHSCGLCPDHKTESISAALMVTTDCDLSCPICFTRGGKAAVPGLQELKRRLQFLEKDAALELCGGEPTTRDDLPQIVSTVKEMGFEYIQLNTNGIRIGREPAFLQSLKVAGLTTVYLGFDGVRPESYLAKSGRDLLPEKLLAIENCRRVGVAVVLVPCVIPGKNDDQLGEMIELAKEWMPTVKGVYFQPVSYFGAYPGTPSDSMRITIPEILRKLEWQTGGEVPAAAFQPGRYEHAACTFGGWFGKQNGRLVPYTSFQKRERAENVSVLRQKSKSMWRAGNMDFLSIGGMAFQDVWTIDLQRLCRCTVHILGEDGTKYPLCAKYITSRNGKRLYPNIS